MKIMLASAGQKYNRCLMRASLPISGFRTVGKSPDANPPVAYLRSTRPMMYQEGRISVMKRARRCVKKVAMVY